jgi:hypothetical protein
MRENSFRAKFERYMRSDPGSADRKRKAYVAVAAKIARVTYAPSGPEPIIAASMK